MSNQNILFMAQKQKLKSERGNLNEGLKDIFLTMDHCSFSEVLERLVELRDKDKKGFDLVLEKFEKLKKDKLNETCVGDVIKKRFIRRNKELNEVLGTLLSYYWTCQVIYDGGYLWCLMPTKKAKESEEQFKIRRERMEDNLMQVMLGVLDDCDFYIHK